MRTASLSMSAAVAASLLLSQASCTALQGQTRLDPAPQAVGPLFQGLLAEDAALHRGAHRFIFEIHGMGDTADNYNLATGKWLTKAGFSARSAPSDWVRVGLRTKMAVAGEGLSCQTGSSNDPCVYESFGRYARQDFTRGATQVTVVTFFWQEDLWQVQGPYLEKDLKEPRALINRYLKNEVVDKGLGDAAGYIGPMGELVREGVRGAVCAMLKMAVGSEVATTPVTLRRGQRGAVMTTGPAGSECLASISNAQLPDNIEFNFISHSLGSRMLLDALAPYTTTRADPTQTSTDDIIKDALVQRTRTIFMAANQVPLLGIGRVRVSEASDGRDGAAPCETGSFLDLRCAPIIEGEDDRKSAEGPIPLRLDVVAFMDPDDLLGYQANSAMMGLGSSDDPSQGGYANVKFTTVRHRNANQWLWTLTVPTTAHDHEMQRKTAATLIFCGARTDGRHKIRPASQCLD
jgi:hypothetical protein